MGTLNAPLTAELLEGKNNEHRYYKERKKYGRLLEK